MRYIFGLDLGQSQDYSALVLVERTPPQRTEEPLKQPVTIPASYAVRFAHRWALGTSYVEVTRDVATRLHREPVHGTGTLILDRTGVGQAVVDYVRAVQLRPIPVHVHGGADVTPSPRGGWNVPKRDLVSCVQILLQQDRLQFARRMPLMEPLLHELQSFRARIDPQTAHDSYSAWREQDHDDLVFSLALACWWGETWADAGAHQIPYGH